MQQPERRTAHLSAGRPGLSAINLGAGLLAGEALVIVGALGVHLLRLQLL
jgi:hypothetical protein